ncbi:MAG: PIG-L family deacetylase [Acidimicrobiales bacterium]
MDAKALWGKLDDSVLESIVVVSPHLDDAALGAAHLIISYPGTTVVTVHAGRPAAYPDEVTEWDALGGFEPGDDVVGARHEEDRAAMESMGANPVWLDFVDGQYLADGDRPSAADIAADLKTAIESANPTAVFLPMGIAHPDHMITHDAGLLVRAEMGEDVSWFCYEDHGYKHLPGMMAWRVSRLFRSGVWPTPSIVPVEVDMAAKRAAIDCYKSQLGPLQRDHLLDERLDANVPEQHWRLATAPRGWERLPLFGESEEDRS